MRKNRYCDEVVQNTKLSLSHFVAVQHLKEYNKWSAKSILALSGKLALRLLRPETS